MPQSNPFSDIERLFEQMSRNVEEAGLVGSDSLSVDVADEGDAFVLLVDLPGYEKDDIEVTAADRSVTVTAERSTEADVDADSYVHRERTHSEVSRRVRLPEAVSETDTTATYDDGVLTVRLPKRGDETAGTSIDIDG